MYSDDSEELQGEADSSIPDSDNDNDNAGDADILGDGSAALEDKFMAYDSEEDEDEDDPGRESDSDKLEAQRSGKMEVFLKRLDRAVVSHSFCYLHGRLV